MPFMGRGRAELTEVPQIFFGPARGIRDIGSGRERPPSDREQTLDWALVVPVERAMEARVFRLGGRRAGFEFLSRG